MFSMASSDFPTHTTMSEQKKQKKKKVKVYTISETIHVSYQIVATSEEDAQEAYRSLPNEEWQEMVADAASNNYCDDEVVDEDDYDCEEDDYPKTEKAKRAIAHNESIKEDEDDEAANS